MRTHSGTIASFYGLIVESHVRSSRSDHFVDFYYALSNEAVDVVRASVEFRQVHDVPVGTRRISQEVVLVAVFVLCSDSRPQPSVITWSTALCSIRVLSVIWLLEKKPLRLSHRRQRFVLKTTRRSKEVMIGVCLDIFAALCI